jgi:hypothetical protein
MCHKLIVLFFIIIQAPFVLAQEEAIKMQISFNISFDTKAYDVSSNLLTDKSQAADPRVSLIIPNYKALIIEGGENINYISGSYDIIRLKPNDTLIFYCVDRDNLIDDIITTFKIPTQEIIANRLVKFEQNGHRITIETKLYHQARLTSVTFTPSADLKKSQGKVFRKKGLQWKFNEDFESEIKYLTANEIIWDVSYEFEALVDNSYRFNFKSYSKSMKAWTSLGRKLDVVTYRGGSSSIKTSYGTFYVTMAAVN